MRRFGDFVIACALLAFTLPLMALIALAIKCESPGPVFERQGRVAPGGRRFEFLTFRTALHEPDDSRRIWAREQTRVGTFLRYTRMDALPQLFNLLRGDISVIEADGCPSPFWD